MERKISAEFETVDMAERAATTVRTRAEGVSRININTWFGDHIKDLELSDPHIGKAYDDTPDSVGYSMFMPGAYHMDMSGFKRFEPAARTTVTLTVTAQEDSVKKIVHMIRSLGALSIKDSL